MVVSYFPMSNGQVERIIGAMKRGIGLLAALGRPEGGDAVQMVLF